MVFFLFSLAGERTYSSPSRVFFYLYCSLDEERPFLRLPVHNLRSVLFRKETLPHRKDYPFGFCVLFHAGDPVGQNAPATDDRRGRLHGGSHEQAEGRLAERVQAVLQAECLREPPAPAPRRLLARAAAGGPRTTPASDTALS